MKAKRLPSGNWNVQVMRDRKSHSFTAPTKKEAERKAAEFIAKKEYSDREGITVQEAMDQYIEAKRNVLSPTTISQYERFASKGLESLKMIPVSRLTSLDVQQVINQESARKKERGGSNVSPKYIKNLYSFIRASVKLARPEFALNVTLPKPVKTFRDLPEPKEIIKVIKGTDIELPALLAMWMSLTASEIRGIKVSSIKDGFLTIDETVVQVDGIAVHKSAGKAYDRNRRLKIPDYIMGLIEKTEAWKKGEGYIEPRSGKAISSNFTRKMHVAGIDMRFHDLRHVFASVGAKLTTQKVLQEMGGWSNPATMINVYQHSFEEDRRKAERDLDRYYNGLLN